MWCAFRWLPPVESAMAVARSPGLLQSAMEQDIWMAAARRNEPDYFPLYAGQSVGVIHDLPGAAEVVETIVREAERVLARLAG
jgi:nitronate monooxygenase